MAGPRGSPPPGIRRQWVPSARPHYSAEPRSCCQQGGERNRRDTGAALEQVGCCREWGGAGGTFTALSSARGQRGAEILLSLADVWEASSTAGSELSLAQAGHKHADGCLDECMECFRSISYLITNGLAVWTVTGAQGRVSA